MLFNIHTLEWDGDLLELFGGKRFQFVVFAVERLFRFRREGFEIFRLGEVGDDSLLPHVLNANRFKRLGGLRRRQIFQKLEF